MKDMEILFPTCTYHRSILASNRLARGSGCQLNICRSLLKRRSRLRRHTWQSGRLDALEDWFGTLTHSGHRPAARRHVGLARWLVWSVARRLWRRSARAVTHRAAATGRRALRRDWRAAALHAELGQKERFSFFVNLDRSAIAPAAVTVVVVVVVVFTVATVVIVVTIGVVGVALRFRCICDRSNALHWHAGFGRQRRRAVGGCRRAVSGAAGGGRRRGATPRLLDRHLLRHHLLLQLERTRLASKRRFAVGRANHRCHPRRAARIAARLRHAPALALGRVLARSSRPHFLAWQSCTRRRRFARRSVAAVGVLSDACVRFERGEARRQRRQLGRHAACGRRQQRCCICAKLERVDATRRLWRVRQSRASKHRAHKHKFSTV